MAFRTKKTLRPSTWPFLNIHTTEVLYCLLSHKRKRRTPYSFWHDGVKGVCKSIGLVAVPWYSMMMGSWKCCTLCNFNNLCNKSVVLCAIWGERVEDSLAFLHPANFWTLPAGRDIHAPVTTAGINPELNYFTPNRRSIQYDEGLC